MIFEISEGGYSIELDQSDSSAWIADKTHIWHYSANGRQLASYTGSSDCQKWFAIVPGIKQIKSPVVNVLNLSNFILTFIR